MKKFLFFIAFILIAFFGIWYIVYFKGFYINFIENKEIRVDFYTKNKEFYNKDNKIINIKGVDVSSSLPGKPASRFAPKKSDYLRWFKQISDMGANAIKVYTVMDDDFYNAFYEYNTTEKHPLYLMQGIMVSDKANYGGNDAYAPDFFNSMLQDGHTVVDIVHGRKDIFSTTAGNNNFYSKDISPWVIGYLVGNDWSKDTIAYTDNSTKYTNYYKGKYFETTQDATVFEAMLDKVLDSIITYETEKYSSQRTIGFINSPEYDFLKYEDPYAKQLGKYAYLNPEHLKPTTNLKSGYYAAYQLFNFCKNFSQYLSPSQINISDNINTSSAYDGYIELLSKYHTIPLVACYGISSARGVLNDNQILLNETQQGKEILNIYNQLKANNWSGCFLATWQDVWEKRNWNTAFSTELTRNPYWHDLLSSGQNNGFLAFDSGKEKHVCTIDGDFSEWSSEDIIIEKDGTSISVKTDNEALYLLIKAKDAPNKKWYIPIDTTEESGSFSSKEDFLTFPRASDFLLCLDGKENSKIKVHEYYNSVLMNFGQEISGRDSFVVLPSNNSGIFNTSYMAIKSSTLLTEEQLSLPLTNRPYPLTKFFTGNLIYGNGNPNSQYYNSLSDFCYGTDGIEVRILWQLLNFSDPSMNYIHSNYYKNYGVKSHHINKIWIGFTNSNKVEDMYPAKLDIVGEHLDYHERLKHSYYILQEEWGKE